MVIAFKFLYLFEAFLFPIVGNANDVYVPTKSNFTFWISMQSEPCSFALGEGHVFGVSLMFS